MKAPQPRKIILCEGKYDQQVMEALAVAHGLGEILEFQEYSQSGSLKKYLGTLKAQGGFAEREIVSLLVTKDADDSAGGAWQSICDAVSDAFGVTLEEPGKEVDAGGVRFCGWVIPGNNRTGMLETLLLDAAREKEGACFPCLDDFMKCVEKTTRRALHEKARFLVWTLLAQQPGAQDRLSLKAALDQLPPDWNAKGFEPLVAVLKHAAGVG